MADVTGIAHFALLNPDSWTTLSQGYAEDFLAEINEEITRLKEEQKYEKLREEFGEDISLDDVKTFSRKSEEFADLLKNIKPMEEITYRESHRSETRVKFTLNSGETFDVRVYRKLT